MPLFNNPPHRQSKFEQTVGISPVGALVLLIAAIVALVLLL